jgi:hypothetical protein
MPRAPHSSALLAGARRRSARLGLGDQRIAHAVDAFEQREGYAVDIGDRNETSCLGMPNEGVAHREIRRLGLLRTKPIDGPGDPFEQA